MVDTRLWANRRRFIILAGIAMCFITASIYTYREYLYVAPTCFDGRQNADEAGVDCGGSCVRMCIADVTMPTIEWVQSFRVVNGQYNTVAYIDNPNRVAATPEMRYTISLEDEEGVIVERSGVTSLPPDNIYPIFEGRIQTGDRVPTKTNIYIEPPELWLPVGDTRQQFTLIDPGRLVDVGTTPKLESTLRNNTLLPIANVEVVTTIFDGNDIPLTSSRTYADFEAESESTAVFTWPGPIADSIRSCEVPTNVMLAIDLSGSMDDLGDNPPQPLTSVKMAARGFVERIRAIDKVGVVSFATSGKLEVPLTSHGTGVDTVISQLTIGPPEVSGTTNSGAGLAIAGQEFISSRHNPGSRKVIILITDGITNEPQPSPEAFALGQAARLANEGVEIYTIGLGININEAFLKDMATRPENMYTAVSAERLDVIYQDITRAICESGSTRIEVIPKATTNFPQWP